MRKIATTTELQHELRQLIDYARSARPSRTVLATELRDLSTRVAIEFSSPAALKQYIKDHPGADKSKHTVKKQEKPKKERSELDDMKDALKDPKANGFDPDDEDDAATLELFKKEVAKKDNPEAKKKQKQYVKDETKKLKEKTLPHYEKNNDYNYR